MSSKCFTFRFMEDKKKKLVLLSYASTGLHWSCITARPFIVMTLISMQFGIKGRKKDFQVTLVTSKRSSKGMKYTDKF